MRESDQPMVLPSQSPDFGGAGKVGKCGNGYQDAAVVKLTAGLKWQMEFCKEIWGLRLTMPARSHKFAIFR